MSCCLQFWGLLARFSIEKRRNVKVTCCEFCSHLLIILILVAGYSLSTVYDFYDQKYDEIILNIPPPRNEELSRSADIYNTYQKFISGPIKPLTLDQYLAASRFISNITSDLNTDTVTDTGLGGSYTNLLYYGDLHFAPAGPEVDSLIQYLNRTSQQFSQTNSFVHKNENAAIDYILKNLEPPTLALIVLDEVTPQRVNYIIRQNYTALPNTNQIVNFPSIGLDTTYQYYFTSGFLTLQRSIDIWAFNYTGATSSTLSSGNFQDQTPELIINAPDTVGNSTATGSTQPTTLSVSSKAASAADYCSAPDAFFIPFPTYAFDRNPFYQQVGFLLGLAMVMTTMYPVSRLTKTVVEEKETRVREIMFIMGMKDSAYVLGWFMNAFILFFWIAFTFTVITAGTFLPNSDISLLFWVYFLFCISEIAFAFLISVLFSNAKLAAIAAPVILFGSVLPRFVFIGTNPNELVTQKILTCLLSPSAFGFAADTIAVYEYGGQGITWNNMYNGDFSFATCLFMLWFDFYLYAALALYFDQVIPQEYGTQRHPLFFLSPRYWCPVLCASKSGGDGDSGPRKNKNKRTEYDRLVLKDTEDEEQMEQARDIPKEAQQDDTDAEEVEEEKVAVNMFDNMPEFGYTNLSTGTNKSREERGGRGSRGLVVEDDEEEQMQAIHSIDNGDTGGGDIELIPADLRPLAKVRVSGLRKRYADGKLAVRNSSFCMLEGQITCLLGHNGSGKSTTQNLLTGLLEATSGDALIYGYSLKKDLRAIRQITGVCPQHNVLFMSLTVIEHLLFFARIKGMCGHVALDAADKVMKDVLLEEKKYSVASSLSGGQKRKLSLAIALIGDPRFVLLDEPTSGMDPHSRRSTWDLLQRCKVGRVIMLTTHFMEEADTLADRVLILSRGKIQCSGSSLFLKNRFGAGYRLSLATDTARNVARINKHSSTCTTAVEEEEGVVSAILSAAQGDKNDIYTDHHDHDHDNVNSVYTDDINATISLDIDAHNNTAAKATTTTTTEVVISAREQSNKHSNITRAVQSILPEAKVSSESTGELIFELPLTAMATYPELFKLLDSRGVELGVSSYGISIVSLEQVFIYLARREQSKHGNIRVLVAEGDEVNRADVDVDLEDEEAGWNLEKDGLLGVIHIVQVFLYECTLTIRDSCWACVSSVCRYCHISVFGQNTDPGANASISSSSILAAQSHELVPPHSAEDEDELHKQQQRVGGGGGDGGAVQSREIHIEGGDGHGDIELGPLALSSILPSSSSSSSSLVSSPASQSTCSVVLPESGAVAGTDDNNNNNNAHGSIQQGKVNNSSINEEGTFCRGGDSTKKSLVWIQLLELLRKRWIIASRDLKGLFFQLIFPAIQILLVLLILTARINPAGRTIALNFDIFYRYDGLTSAGLVASGNVSNITYYNYNATANGTDSITTDDDSLFVTDDDFYGLVDLLNGDDLLSNNPQSDNLLAFCKNDLLTYWPARSEYIDTYKYNASNSSEVGDVLLDPIYYTDFRYGAVAFNDNIKLNATVDWEWVKDSAEFFLENPELTAGLLEAFGVNLGFNLTAIPVGDFSFTVELDSTLLLNTDGQTQAINDALAALTEAINNSTAIQILANTTTGDLLLTLLDLLNVTAPPQLSLNPTNQFVNQTVTVSATDVTYNAIDQTLDVGNAYIVFNDTLVDIGSLTIAVANFTNITEILNLILPNGTVQYTLSIDSPFTVMHNSSSPHAIAATNGELVSAAFRHCSPAGTTTAEYVVKNRPLPLTKQENLEIRVLLSLFASLFMLIPLCYIPASFVSFLVKERVSKSKHLQTVSGVSPYLYWIGAYLWDLSLFAVLISCILIIIFSFGEKAAAVFISTNEATLAFVTLLVTYGASSLAISYIYSFAFDNFSTAQITIMAINFFTGFIFCLAYYIMISIEETKEAGEALVHVFRLFPPYNIGEGLILMSTAYFQVSVFNSNIDYFSWKVTGRNIMFMIVETIVYFSIVLLSESRVLRMWFNDATRKYLELQPKLRRLVGMHSSSTKGGDGGYEEADNGESVSTADQDVVIEAERVRQIRDYLIEISSNKSRQGQDGAKAGEPIEEKEEEEAIAQEASAAALVIYDLEKIYPSSLLGGLPPKRAVCNLSFACKFGERFGLLGVNGAGKSTTVGVLTGDVQRNAGDVFIGGLALDDPKAQRAIGYCPQVDPLLDLMTSRETLRLFGRIRGLDEHTLESKVSELIDQVGLTPYADRPCGTYSGGNRRKLSLAVALIGDPSVLILDEPSTGLDPEARRNMWSVVDAVSSNRCVILVSHSMDEVEALCSRVGVMVGGQLRCLGSAQHLKARFGGGYQLELRCAVENVEKCMQLCWSLLPKESTLDETLGGYFRIHVPSAVESHLLAAAAAATTTPIAAIGAGLGSSIDLTMSAFEGNGGDDSTGNAPRRLKGEINSASSSGSLDLSTIFATLEKHKEELNIYDFSLSQASIEQIFLKMAKGSK